MTGETIRLGNPQGRGPEPALGVPAGFDPVWGTLGAPDPGDARHSFGRDVHGSEGPAVDVDVFGNGFAISGQVRTGQFDRLSGWINMQNGFIQIHDARPIHPGRAGSPGRNRGGRTLWVRLDQVVLVAETLPVPLDRPGAPIVQKERRMVSIVTAGYDLRGLIYVHAHGTMNHYLEATDPHFLAMTEVTVRPRAERAVEDHFPFAIVNRRQVVTVFDESASPADESADAEVLEAVTALR